MPTEQEIENDLVQLLKDLKYVHRTDIKDRATLEANFRQKFEDLNRVSLTDNEFRRLLEQVTINSVYEAVRHLREINTFEREDGTPLHYTLVKKPEKH